MTRASETEIEHLVRTALLEWCGENYASVQEIRRDRNDRPDIAITVDGKRIACESTCIPDSKIYKKVISKYEIYRSDGVVHVEVLWPKEPHMWVRNAIRRKNTKVSSYLSSVEADEAWLLLHPIDIAHETFTVDRQEMFKMAEFGAGIEEHHFDKILIWSPEKKVRQIYPSSGRWDSIEFKDLSHGYPVEGYGVVLGESCMETPVGEAGGVEFKYLFVEPDEPKFKNRKPNHKKRELSVFKEALNNISSITIGEKS